MKNLTDFIFDIMKPVGDLISGICVFCASIVAIFALPYAFAFGIGKMLTPKLFSISEVTQNSICGFLYFTGLALIIGFVDWLASKPPKYDGPDWRSMYRPG